MTKPIELGVAKAGLSKADLAKQARSSKTGAGAAYSAPTTTEPRSEAEIMALSPARTRKSKGPKPEIFEQIGQRLRDVYNGVVTQAVPDRFLDLLQELETSARAGAAGVPKAAAAGPLPRPPDDRTTTGRKKGEK